jgi:AcrR family transcriptional regulator
MIDMIVKASEAPGTSIRERSREALVVAAERLIAEEGVGVSSRRIAAEAGHRNTAAIQYHFGSRAALYRAVIELRLPGIDRRRTQMLEALRAEGRHDDLRGLVEALVTPLLELDREAHYVAFLARMSIDTVELAGAYLAAGESSRSAVELTDALLSQLDDLAPGVRSNRIRLVNDMMLNGIANRRAREAQGGDELDEALFASDLIDAIVGALSAR